MAVTTTAPRPTALVTGASGGIGFELAKLFAADGYDLVLIARTTSTLKAAAAELAKAKTDPSRGTIRTIAADLSEPDAPQRIYDELATNQTAVDVLVNNAGFGDRAAFVEADPAKIQGMIATNVTALTQLTKLFLPGMVARGQGKILNVASIAAFLPGPLMAVYYATKAYVASFSQALSNELAGSGVTVTALCPGPTDTGFASAAAAAGKPLFKNADSAARVARDGYRAMISGKPLEIVGPRNKFGIWLLRFIPRRAQAKIARRAQE